MAFNLTKSKLLFDLYYAFECAKKHKSHKKDIILFEKNLHGNLNSLCEDLWNHIYKPLPSFCFIIEEPKKREIFAANFRDRIVHHLYYNYTHQLFESTFISDSYSCIKNRGTHYGIQRLGKHIRQESQNYSKECYVLKMDIKGYFININRQKLLQISNNVLGKMKNHISSCHKKKWEDILDFQFIYYLNETIILQDPTINCFFSTNKQKWLGLPKSKSLFTNEKGYGLPIGNLTSQLLSNVFLNVLDQYMKRELKCKHYGRYVDDFYVVSKNKEFLMQLIPLIKDFLKRELFLDLHMGKTTIRNIKYGIEFLGAFLKPYRTFISNKTLKKIKFKLYSIQKYPSTNNIINRFNSYLGLLSHYNSFNVKIKNFILKNNCYKYGKLDSNLTKITSWKKYLAKKNNGFF